MEHSNIIEKRKYARLELISKINFTIIETTNEEQITKRFKGIGKNIGVEGLLFTSNKELKLETILSLEIFLPYVIDPIYIDGEVRWCKKTNDKNFDIGIKFTSIDKNHVLLLIKCVCGKLTEEDHNLIA